MNMEEELMKTSNKLRLAYEDIGKLEERLSKACIIAQNGLEKESGECKEVLAEIMTTLNS